VARSCWRRACLRTLARLPQLDMSHQRRWPWRLTNSQPQSDPGQRRTRWRSALQSSSAALPATASNGVRIDAGSTQLAWPSGPATSLAAAADCAATFATVRKHPDGSPHLQEITGPLVMRFTNTDTGRSVVRNLTGTGLLDNGSDGSLTLYLVGGHMAVGLAATDPGGPAFLVFTGSRHAVVFGADGSRTPIYGHGPVENLCATLAG
jgi:hypothetical protein